MVPIGTGGKIRRTRRVEPARRLAGVCLPPRAAAVVGRHGAARRLALGFGAHFSAERRRVARIDRPRIGVTGHGDAQNDDRAVELLVVLLPAADRDVKLNQ